MLKKFRLALLLTFLCSIMKAQTNLEDVVYLKNGSIIRGIIIEQVPSQSLKIQTRDRNVFVFKMDEIEKMTRENPGPAETSPSTFQLKKSGFAAMLEINRAWGFERYAIENSPADYNQTFSGGRSFGVRFINGFRFSPHFFGGIGVGLDFFPDIYYLTNRYRIDKARFIPITFDFRTHLTNTRWSPMINLAAGYAVGIDDLRGGLIINPQIGCQGFISDKVAVFFSVGYKWQGRDQWYVSRVIRNSNYYQNSYDYSQKNILFGFFTINSGFSF